MGDLYKDMTRSGWVRPAIAIVVILVAGVSGYLFYIAPDATGVAWDQSADLSGSSDFEFTVKNTGIQTCEFTLTINLYAANDTVVAQKQLRGGTIPGGEEKTVTTSMTNAPASADSVVYRPRCTNHPVENIIQG